MSKFKHLQLTLAILKPDLTANPIARQKVMSVILQNNFYIVKSKKMHLTRLDSENFYKEHEGRFFYNRLVGYMCSGPLSTHILARREACKHWRSLLGPTKVFKSIYSAPNSLRGLYGLTDTRNSTHGSDGPQTAEREIKFFFPEFDINLWYDCEERFFSSGQVKYNPELEIHVLNENIMNHKHS